MTSEEQSSGTPLVLRTCRGMQQLEDSRGTEHYKVCKYHQSTGKVHAQVLKVRKPTFTTPDGPETFLDVGRKPMQGKAQRLQCQGGASKALDLSNGGPHSRRNLEQPSIKPLQHAQDQLPMGPLPTLIGFKNE